MIGWILIILLILWLLGAFWFPVGGLIHILLVIVIVIVVYRLVTGQRLL